MTDAIGYLTREKMKSLDGMTVVVEYDWTAWGESHRIEGNTVFCTPEFFASILHTLDRYRADDWTNHD